YNCPAEPASSFARHCQDKGSWRAKIAYREAEETKLRHQRPSQPNGPLVLGRQLLQQRLRLLQIARVEAFGEPVVDRREADRGLAAACPDRANGNSVHETAAITLYAAIGRLIPFNSNSRTGSTFTAFSTFINTRGLIRIWPGFASSHSREATLDTLPMAA